MPFIRITLDRNLPANDRTTLANRSTDLIVNFLGKRREVTAVLVETVAADLWTIGGKASNAPTAHCEIAVTQDTNTAADIARFISEMRDLLADTLGGLAEACYVIVRTIPAENWGYDGRTQASRRMTNTGVAA
jgi:4-oxalocrotonate tautomerase